MESEILKEPWVFPRTKASPTKEEDTSAWEEDFQDLSSWCMDTFQAQCDFHIGTKYEGNGVSTVEEDGILKGLRSSTDEKRNLKMDTVKMTTEESSDNRHLPLSPLNNKCEKGYGNEENYASSSWLMSPESTASTSTSSSKQHNTTDVSAPFQPEYRRSNDYACLTSFNSTASQHEKWDELPTIEAIGSDTFDLLSYLCDDEICSPEGSVSTDSSAMLKHRPFATSSPTLTPSSAKVKTDEMSEPPKRRRMETRATSTMTSSSSVEIPTTSSRRSERTRSLASNKDKERTTVKAKRDKSEKKKYYESDSEGEDVTLTQYRESREKNNEASRKSRMNKKAKESEMAMKAMELEKDNKILKMKVEELEKLVTSMRNALLQSALKREF
ncbi:hypothetical protein EAI_07058 [Harpegnathos saltator]|uniref:BZIP domain-containing protein n=1 Tax=Harpegnathos saltator TaxID=610380 RepID=E2BVG2_HARSA|nr:hypothetical protein EAI_07058 [Harpegnathos saltator]